MLRVIPRHFIDDVRKDLKRRMQHPNTLIRRQPFR